MLKISKYPNIFCNISKNLFVLKISKKIFLAEEEEEEEEEQEQGEEELSLPGLLL